MSLNRVDETTLSYKNTIYFLFGSTISQATKDILAAVSNESLSDQEKIQLLDSYCQNGNNINDADYSGTILKHAVLSDSVALVEWICNHPDINPNLQACQNLFTLGQTIQNITLPIHTACTNITANTPAIVLALIKAGARTDNHFRLMHPYNGSKKRWESYLLTCEIIIRHAAELKLNLDEFLYHSIPIWGMKVPRSVLTSLLNQVMLLIDKGADICYVSHPQGLIADENDTTLKNLITYYLVDSDLYMEMSHLLDKIEPLTKRHHLISLIASASEQCQQEMFTRFVNKSPLFFNQFIFYLNGLKQEIKNIATTARVMHQVTRLNLCVGSVPNEILEDVVIHSGINQERAISHSHARALFRLFFARPEPYSDGHGPYPVAPTASSNEDEASCKFNSKPF